MQETSVELRSLSIDLENNLREIGELKNEVEQK